MRRADGRWRLYAFADAAGPGDPASRLRALCEHLEHSPDSPVRRYTPVGADVDSVLDVRAVFQQHHRDLALADLPSLLVPRKGRYGLVDYEKAFTPDSRGDDIFDLRRIARDQGALVVPRAPARRLRRVGGVLRPTPDRDRSPHHRLSDQPVRIGKLQQAPRARSGLGRVGAGLLGG